MTTQVLSASRAGVSSVVVHETSTKTYVIPGFILTESPSVIPGTAQMDGQAQAQFAGATVLSSAARMDGQAQATFHGAIWGTGAAEMDGLAQVLFVGAGQAKGAARMDGAASMVATTPFSLIARMDGAASMIAVGASNAPGHFIVGMLEHIISSDVITTLDLSHSGALQNFSMQDRISVVLNQMLGDSIVASHSSKTFTRYHWVATNTIFIEPSPIPVHKIIIALAAQNLTMGLSLLGKFTWGRALVQALQVHDAVSVWTRYTTALMQLFKFADGFRITRALTLQQNISLHPSHAVASILQLLQKFLVASTASPVLTYHFALAGRVIVKDILGHFVSVVLAQLFTIHPALTRQFTTSNSLAQLLTVHPALNNKLVLQIIGNLQLSPDQLVHMLYKGDPLLDGVVITALYISPSGTTTTWAVNTRTNAVTEYLNYDFNSFALLDRRYIASSSDGLYELDGDTDDGALIISELMSGYFQFNEKKLFGIKGAYVAIRGGGRFYLKLIAGDGREYVYELKAQPNLMTTKVKIGKGISTTYMAFDLVTEGQDFDLDSLEFIPMTRGRRV